jgi:hypothetical protein
MGSVTSLPSGLAYLTQPGGLLSNLPAGISTSVLQSASPQDIVSLSLAAIQAQEVGGLFGVSPATSNSAIPGLPAATGVASGVTSGVTAGIPAADLTNATPQEQAQISDQSLLYQQAQALFDPTSATSTNVNLNA